MPVPLPRQRRLVRIALAGVCVMGVTLSAVGLGASLHLSTLDAVDDPASPSPVRPQSLREASTLRRLPAPDDSVPPRPGGHPTRPATVDGERRQNAMRALAGAAERDARREAGREAARRELPLEFRVASFNVLGASHTGANGRHARFAGAEPRMRLTVRLLQQLGISVAGFQEFQPSQHVSFDRLAPGWSVFPGPSQGRDAMVNAVVWRADLWEPVRTETVQIPYFGGRPRPMPYVLLRHRPSGREIWFASFHNPADAHGPAQRWRDAATDRQVALADLLVAGGAPVVFTGDMNDRERYFCPMTTRSAMHAANGGSHGTPCAPPPAMRVDWIMGSEPVTFSNYVAVDGGLAAQASDHPLVVADASIRVRK